MKRLAVLGVTAFVAAAASASTARAQLTMQMSNGWNFSFAGNVNAFYVEQFSDAKAGQATVLDGSGGGFVNQGQGTNANVRTGLLPAAATFDAKGKEGNLNIGVHFGFFPEIQNGGGAGGNSHDQFGAQIDMRQVYLTVGGSWGQILAGRELALFNRQNILTDATLFGIGATGGNLGAGGTTLGRIGFGYEYPNFNAQITYSTPTTSPLQWSIGVFQPSAVASFIYVPVPRFETELSYTSAMSGSNKVMVWLNGTWQHAQDHPTGVGSDTGAVITQKVDAWGGGAGIKLDVSQLSLVGSGYYGRGLGNALQFGSVAVDNNPAGPQLRPSYGYIGQVSIKLSSQWSVVGSWGESLMSGTTFDENNPATEATLMKYNALGVGSLVYQWTKSLKWVAEWDYTEQANQAHQKNVANQIGTGLMVFF